ncbi:MAG: ABC transporter ATP-binding protein [Nitrososphaerales archaeon]
MMKIEALTKTYSRGKPPAIEGVSFDVGDGETVGFVGLNGAGKTTTIKVAAGVLLPTAGTVLVDGHDIVRDKVKASMSSGWVPEFPNFDMGSKASSLMKYYAGFYKIGRDTDLRCAEVLKAVGLAGVEGKKLREFSQGMKKRFMLGVALLSDPRNLLFDEVLNGLDPEGIAYFRQLVVDYKKQGKAVLFSSHLLSEVQALADKIVVIHRGKIVKSIRREELAVVGDESLRIVLSNTSQKAIDYLMTLGEVAVDGNTMNLKGYAGDPASVSMELAKMGCAVSELERVNQSLEAYFFRLIGASEGKA